MTTLPSSTPEQIHHHSRHHQLMDPRRPSAPTTMQMPSRKRRASSCDSSCSSSSSQITVDDGCSAKRSCNSQRQGTNNTKKSVCFDLSRNTTQRALLSQEDSDHEAAFVQRCWFSPDELNQVLLREVRIVQTFSASDLYRQQVMQLLSNVTHQDASTQVEAPHQYVADSPARGLESQIVGCIRVRRKQVVQTFLKSQKGLSAWRGPAEGGSEEVMLTADFQRHALAEHYQKLSAPAVRLACLLAQGDAHAAVKADQEEIATAVSFGSSSFEW